MTTADETTERFFGDAWKTSTSRNWVNYISDLETQEDTEDDEAILLEIVTVRKQAQAARMVLSKIAAHGMTSSCAVRAYNDQVAWLLMGEVAAPNPFPKFMRLQILSQDAMDAWPAQRFWSKIVDSQVQDSIELRLSLRVL